MDFTGIIKDILYAIITAAVPILFTYLVKYLNSIFKKAKLETEELAIHSTISEVLDLVLSVVMKTSQTFVDSLKESGNFDEEAQKKAFNDTKDEIIALLSVEAIEIIEILYNDVESWISVQIEAAVRRIKQ